MNDYDYALNIRICYKNKEYQIDGIKEMITLEELIERSLKACGINNKNKNKDLMIFTYKDEQGDINIIENFEDIIKISEEDNEYKLLSKINLEILNSKTRDNEKKKNIIENKLKNKYIEENTKLIEKLEEMNKEKDNKIELLNNIIINIKNDCSNKITKMKSMMQRKLNDIIVNYFERNVEDSISKNDFGNIKKVRNNGVDTTNKIVAETQNLRKIIENICFNLKYNEDLLDKIESNLAHENMKDINIKNYQEKIILLEENNNNKSISINEKKEEKKTSNKIEKRNENFLLESNDKENILNDLKKNKRKKNENKKKDIPNKNKKEESDLSNDNIYNEIEIENEEKIDEPIKSNLINQQFKNNKTKAKLLELNKERLNKVKKYKIVVDVNKDEENLSFIEQKNKDKKLLKENIEEEENFLEKKDEEKNTSDKKDQRKDILTKTKKLTKKGIKKKIKKKKKNDISNDSINIEIGDQKELIKNYELKRYNTVVEENKNKEFLPFMEIKNKENNSFIKKDKEYEDNNYSQKKDKSEKKIKKKKLEHNVLNKDEKGKSDISSDSLNNIIEDENKSDELFKFNDKLIKENIFKDDEELFQDNSKEIKNKEENSPIIELDFKEYIDNTDEENNSFEEEEKEHEDNNSPQKKDKKKKKALKRKKSSRKGLNKNDNSLFNNDIQNKTNDNEINENSIDNKDNSISSNENSDEHFNFKEEDFEQKLNKYFFDKKGKIKFKFKIEEFEEIKQYYIILKENNINFECIKFLQKDYIKNKIKLDNERIEKRQLLIIKIKKLQELLSNKNE